MPRRATATVHRSDRTGLSAGSGVLILALDNALRMRNMSVSFRAARDIDATLEHEDLEGLRTTLYPAES